MASTSLSWNDVIALAKMQDEGVEVTEDDELFSQLYDYFSDEMPYGIAKARTGDPTVWISEKLSDIFCAADRMTGCKCG